MYTYLACRILENHHVNLHPNCLPYKDLMFKSLLITSRLKLGHF